MVDISDTLFTAIQDELNDFQNKIDEAEKERITVVDSIMGSGKTSWAFQDLLNKHLDENILYISPFLSEIEGENGRIPKAIKSGEIKRDIVTPKNKGSGKLGNIAN